MIQVLGWNIHLRYLKNPGGLVSRIRPFQSSTHTVMVDDPKRPEQEDQTKYIVELAAQLPESLIVARVKHDQDAGYHTKPVNHPANYVASPDDFLNKWEHLGRGNMTLYTLNEPDDGIDDQGAINTEAVYRLNTWFVETATKAAERGVSITGPNFGKGIPALENDEWHPAFDPILTVLSKYRGLHFLGLHEYGPEEEPFHLGRYKAMLRRCAVLNLPPPRIIFTEFGVDKNHSGDQVVNGYKSRGWTGTYYVNWKLDKLRRIYKADIESGLIAGFDTFCEGASSPEWEPFDVEEDAPYWTELGLSRNEGRLMATRPLVQFMAKPENARSPMTITLKSTRSLRAGAGTYFNEQTIIPAGSVMTWYDFPVVPVKEGGKLYHWKWGECKGQGGWICSTDTAFEPVLTQPPVDEPAKPEEPPTDESPTQPDRKERRLEIVVTATDAEWAQMSVLAENAVQALVKLAGLSEQMKLFLPRLVIHDQSIKEGNPI